MGILNKTKGKLTQSFQSISYFQVKGELNKEAYRMENFGSSLKEGMFISTTMGEQEHHSSPSLDHNSNQCCEQWHWDKISKGPENKKIVKIGKISVKLRYCKNIF